jgi:hypothetical protein
MTRPRHLEGRRPILEGAFRAVSAQVARSQVVG